MTIPYEPLWKSEEQSMHSGPVAWEHLAHNTAPVATVPFPVPMPVYEAAKDIRLNWGEIVQMQELMKQVGPTPVTTEATRADAGKVRWDLLPYESLEEIAKVMTWGATKYGEENWRSGLSFGRCFAATMRHLTAWWGGQTNDPESGINHLAHAGTNILFMISYSVRNLPVDNRPKVK